MRPIPQDRIRKDVIIAQFYHACKMNNISCIVAYRDYYLSDKTIDFIILNKDGRIIAAVLVRNNKPLKRKVDFRVFRLSNPAGIIDIISDILELEMTSYINRV